MDTIKLGKYELLESLGRGGFGTVYRASDTALGREVAVKVLHPQLMVDPGFVERFRNEARLVAGLEHPNLVTVYDLGESEGRAYLVMRYLPGKSLRERLQNGPIPFNEALGILKQVAAGLLAAHARGIIHRDIKPENILFTEDGQAVISDFGLAKAVLGGSSSSSSSSGGVGTPSYRAPELWRGKPPASPATDQYALACVFVEMLTGQRLFAGDTPDEIITKHLVDGAELPKSWPIGVPAGIENVIGKALQKDPDKRYGNISELIDALIILLRSKSKIAQQPLHQSTTTRLIAINKDTQKSALTIALLVVAIILGSFLVFKGLEWISASGIKNSEIVPATQTRTQILNSFQSPVPTSNPTSSIVSTRTSPPPTATKVNFQATQSAQNTKTVTTLLAPKYSWEAKFSEIFASNSNSWFVGKLTRNSRTISVDVKNGEYVWTVPSGKGLLDWVEAPVERINYNNFHVEFQGTIAVSNSNPTFALFYGNNSGLYTMGFNPNEGSYDSAYLDLGKNEFKSIITWTPSKAIKIGATNKIAAYFSDGRVNLFINDQLVHFFYPEKSTLPITTFGIMIGLQEGNAATYRFDNFQILAPRESSSSPSTQIPTQSFVDDKTLGNKIAFVSDRNCKREDLCNNIYVMNADGTNLQSITTDTTLYNYNPTFLPSGKELAYMIGYGMDDDDLVLLDLNNFAIKNKFKLTGVRSHSKVSWFTQGKGVYGNCLISGGNEINLFDTNTGSTSILLHDDDEYCWVYEPTWSFDGKKIVFSSKYLSPPGIYMMNPDGSNKTLLLNLNEPTDCRWFDFSPVDYRVLMSCDGDLYILNTETKSRIQLTNTPYYDGSPTWSPDGNWIAYMSIMDDPNHKTCTWAGVSGPNITSYCNSEIYTMRADGTDIKRLTFNDAFDTDPDWGP